VPHPEPTQERTEHRTGRRLLLFGAVALMLASSCTTSPGDPARSGVDVSLSDFAIATSVTSVAAGEVDLHVRNQAPATHEFVIVRSDLPSDALPIGPDGLSVDEEELTPIGELPQVDTEETDTLSVNLAPGRYVFFCNLEGHYLGGMHAVLEVTGDV